MLYSALAVCGHILFSLTWSYHPNKDEEGEEVRLFNVFGCSVIVRSNRGGSHGLEIIIWRLIIGLANGLWAVMRYATDIVKRVSPLRSAASDAQPSMLRNWHTESRHYVRSTTNEYLKALVQSHGEQKWADMSLPRTSLLFVSPGVGTEPVDKGLEIRANISLIEILRTRLQEVDVVSTGLHPVLLDLTPLHYVSSQPIGIEKLHGDALRNPTDRCKKLLYSSRDTVLACAW